MNGLPLAFQLFFDPITAIYPNLDRYWLLLLVPLVIGICVVYKGTRVRELRDLPRAATVMTIQVLIVMAIAAAVIDGVYLLITRYA